MRLSLPIQPFFGSFSPLFNLLHHRHPVHSTEGITSSSSALLLAHDIPNTKIDSQKRTAAVHYGYGCRGDAWANNVVKKRTGMTSLDGGSIGMKMGEWRGLCLGQVFCTGGYTEGCWVTFEWEKETREKSICDVVSFSSELKPVIVHVVCLFILIVLSSSSFKERL